MAGFELAISYLVANGIPYEFLGLIDADTVVEPRYFEKLLDEFNNDPKLGLASGGLFFEKGRTFVLELGDRNSPRGTGRLWRKTCFFETDGYMVCDAPPDAISNVKAKLLGYGAKQFRSIVALQLRLTSSAEGIWAGYEKRGKAWYYLNAHPVLVMMNAIHFTARPSLHRGVAFFVGYLTAFVRRTAKIDDEEIRRYFWRDRPWELIAETFGKRGA